MLTNLAQAHHSGMIVPLKMLKGSPSLPQTL